MSINLSVIYLPFARVDVDKEKGLPSFSIRNSPAICKEMDEMSGKVRSDRPKPFVCATCGLAYETAIALQIWCTRLHAREAHDAVETENESLPWKMTPGAWEIFKVAPEKWKEQVEGGRLIFLADHSLSTPEEEGNTGRGLMRTEPSNLLNEKQAAKRLGIRPQTLEKWRTRRYGPVYVKLGGRVRYFAGDIDAWIVESRVDPAKRKRPRRRTK